MGSRHGTCSSMGTSNFSNFPQKRQSPGPGSCCVCPRRGFRAGASGPPRVSRRPTCLSHPSLHSTLVAPHVTSARLPDT